MDTYHERTRVLEAMPYEELVDQPLLQVYVAPLEPVATGPGRVYCWEVDKLAGHWLRHLRDDRHLLALHPRGTRPQP
ncbi:MAG TPA: hypothetical protein VFQ11_02230 [Nocardioidaceae bacterium]|nr:hypothetical protein [Nocardioidaceae bacterium]